MEKVFLEMNRTRPFETREELLACVASLGWQKWMETKRTEFLVAFPMKKAEKAQGKGKVEIREFPLNDLEFFLTVASCDEIQFNINTIEKVVSIIQERLQFAWGEIFQLKDLQRIMRALGQSAEGKKEELVALFHLLVFTSVGKRSGELKKKNVETEKNMRQALDLVIDNYRAIQEDIPSYQTQANATQVNAVSLHDILECLESFSSKITKFVDSSNEAAVQRIIGHLQTIPQSPEINTNKALLVLLKDSAWPSDEYAEELLAFLGKTYESLRLERLSIGHFRARLGCWLFYDQQIAGYPLIREMKKSPRASHRMKQFIALIRKTFQQMVEEAEKNKTAMEVPKWLLTPNSVKARVGRDMTILRRKLKTGEFVFNVSKDEQGHEFGMPMSLQVIKARQTNPNGG